uniref:Nucleoside diphosphate kinase-like domain-containing protein n=1 Tax=Cyprinus carpio TaxID=7962 RepID=A0A8C1R164_CYPCA
MSSGPSLALGLLRVNAVKRLLQLMGPEDPDEARTIDQTLRRAQYGSDRLHNEIYGQRSDKNNQILKKKKKKNSAAYIRVTEVLCW